MIRSLGGWTTAPEGAAWARAPRFVPPASRDVTAAATRSHVVLLSTAFVLLQLPQFISGTVAVALMSVLFAYSFLTWPRTRIMYGPLVALFALMTASLFWSENPGVAWPDVASAGVAIVCGLAVGGALSLDKILVTAHRTTVVIALVSLVLGFAIPSIGILSGPEYSGTLRGIYIHKNPLAAVILFGALAVLFRQWPDGRGRISRAGSLLLYLVVLWRCDSATIVALLVAGVAILGFYRWWVSVGTRGRFVALHLLVASTIGVAFFATALFQGVLGLLGRDSTLTGRTDIWKAAILAWRETPWVGVGWGSFSTDSRVSYYQEAMYGWVRDHAHSGYVQVLTELGILGAATVAMVMLATILRVVRTVTAHPLAQHGWLVAATAAIVAHNVVEQSMKGLPLFMLALIWAACDLVNRESAWTTRLGERSSEVPTANLAESQ